jgi:CheY-like chemotaxis protein
METHVATVLVVDDGKADREAISMIPASQGYTVFEANRAADASRRCA